MRRRRKKERTPWEVRPAAAPGDLSLVQGFVNTVDRKFGNDELASPEAGSCRSAAESAGGNHRCRRSCPEPGALRPAVLVARSGSSVTSRS